MEWNSGGGSHEPVTVGGGGGYVMGRLKAGYNLLVLAGGRGGEKGASLVGADRCVAGIYVGEL